MKIRMLETRLGVANAVGSRTHLYRGGQAYAMEQPWQRALAAVFVAAGWAEPLGAPAPASAPARGSARRKARRATTKRDR